MTTATNAVGLRELLEAGVHFGHQTRRWNPKMRRYIFGEREGIYIVDLLRTEVLLAEAQAFVELSLGKQNLGAEQVDDIDAFALAEDVTTHLWIPTARLVPEVNSSLQQFPQSDRVCGGGHTYSLG